MGVDLLRVALGDDPKPEISRPNFVPTTVPELPEPTRSPVGKGQARCGICGETYGLGPPSGTVWVWYPRGESRYWAHVQTSERHQNWLDNTAIQQAVLLKQAGVILKEAQKIRNRERAREKREEAKRAKITATAED